MFIQDFYESIAGADREGVFLLGIALHNKLTMRWSKLLLFFDPGQFRDVVKTL